MRLKMLTLSVTSKIIAGVLQKGAELGLNPLTVTVLDSAGIPRAMLSQDGSSPLRHKIAHGKAFGAVGLGIGSRAIFKRAQEQPFFVGAVATAADGALIPVPGGVLIRSSDGAVLGAVGVTGDSSDNDEAAAIYGIEQAGLVADAG
jgi:uncharacterized protein GlcG (DUF336 family)